MSIAVAAGLGAWGAIFGFAPRYLGLSGYSAAPFVVLSVASYVFAIVGAFVGVGQLLRSQFLSYVGIAFGFGAIAYFIHTAADATPSDTLRIALRLGAITLICFATMSFVMGFPYLFASMADSDRRAGSRKSVGASVSGNGGNKTQSRFEQIAAAIVALLALVTALIQLMVELW
jgi:hypothetical protein